MNAQKIQISPLDVILVTTEGDIKPEHEVLLDEVLEDLAVESEAFVIVLPEGVIKDFRKLSLEGLLNLHQRLDEIIVELTKKTSYGEA